MPYIHPTEPLGPAIRITRDILLKPFKFRKWLGFALTVWLAVVGHGIGVEYVNPTSLLGNWIGWPRIGSWMMHHLFLFEVYLILGTLVVFAVYVFYRWINALGELAFISQIIRNTGRVRPLLAEQRKAAWSLAWFIIKWEFIVLNCAALLIISCAAVAIPDIVHSWPEIDSNLLAIVDDPGQLGAHYHPTAWTIAALISAGVTLFFFMLLQLPLYFCLSQLTIPIIYHTKMPPGQAFVYTLTHIFFPNLRACLLYFLMVIVTGIAISGISGLATLVMGVITLGIGWALTYVPVLSNLPLYVVALLILPLLVFNRAYSLTFLEQFEERFQINWLMNRPTGFEVVMNAAPTSPHAGSDVSAATSPAASPDATASGTGRAPDVGS